MKKFLDIVRICAFFVSLLAVVLVSESEQLVYPVVACMVLAVCGWQLNKVDLDALGIKDEE